MYSGCKKNFFSSLFISLLKPLKNVLQLLFHMYKNEIFCENILASKFIFETILKSILFVYEIVLTAHLQQFFVRRLYTSECDSFNYFIFKIGEKKTNFETKLLRFNSKLDCS